MSVEVRYLPHGAYNSLVVGVPRRLRARLGSCSPRRAAPRSVLPDLERAGRIGSSTGSQEVNVRRELLHRLGVLAPRRLSRR